MADQYSVQESGTSREMEKFNMVRWKSGKSVDPRMFTLLEMFKELYVKRQEFFKKIFPGLYDDFAELFERVGGVFSESEGAKARTMTRSLSFGSGCGAKQDDESTLRLERFKVRTLAIGGVQSSGQGDNKSNNP